MNALGLAFVVMAGTVMLCAPRAWAALALLLSAAYMTDGQVVQLGSANFSVLRIVVAIGFVRVVLRGERLACGLHSVDRWVLLWAAVLFGSSVFHMSEAWLFRAGLLWTELGSYFLLRLLLGNLDDVRRLFRLVSVAMLPVALAMLVEWKSGTNLFVAVLGGAHETAAMRGDRFRASGPFAHAILAGTVGAACVAIGLAQWSVSRSHAVLAMFGGLVMVYASTSSSPALMTLFVALAGSLWRLRQHMRAIRWAILAAILALAAVMKAPVYFVIARIDLTGGSQGYFRAQLIHSAIEHFSEWWLAGTDYTRHWMATGIAANERHTDMTNHFLSMGVMGGVALMTIFLIIIGLSFRDAGRAVHRSDNRLAPEQALFVWMLGALLFGFTLNFLSITLFDQSVIFFWLTVAAIQSVQPSSSPVAAPDEAIPVFGAVIPRRPLHGAAR